MTQRGPVGRCGGAGIGFEEGPSSLSDVGEGSRQHLAGIMTTGGFGREVIPMRS
jgi:hypothetical protein